MWFLMIAVVVLVVSAITDLVWVKLIDCISRRAALLGGAWSGALALIGALGTYAYVHDERMLVPYVVGSALGTYMAIRRLPARKAETDANTNS